MMSKKIAKTATQAISILWEEGYFKSWRKQADLVDHLAERDNHFSAPELGMSLKRASFLTKKGTRGSYEYIQKHPFVEEVNILPEK